MEKELRRRRISLMTLGSGVIAFGVWSLLKTFLYLWVDPIPMDFEDIPPEFRHIAVIIGYVLVGIFMAIDLSLRLYLGRSARAAGRGTKKSCAYIVVAVLLLASSAVSLILILFSKDGGRTSNQSVMDYYVSLFVEFTSMSILAELVYTAIRVKKLEKLLEG